MTEPSGIMNQKQVAENREVSVWTVQRWEKSGILTRIDMPGAWYNVKDVRKIPMRKKFKRAKAAKKAAAKRPMRVSDLP